MTGTYLVQWDRIRRWRARVVSTRDHFRADGTGTDEHLDELYAAFQAVWHLKDWIKNDPSLPSTTTADVEPWINKNGSALLVAADIANGSKHMILTSQRAGGSTHSRTDINVHVGRGISATFYVEDKATGVEHEAVALIDLCIAEWTKFLGSHGLSAPAIT